MSRNSLNRDSLCRQEGRLRDCIFAVKRWSSDCISTSRKSSNIILSKAGSSRELPAFDKMILLDFLEVLIQSEFHLLTAMMQSSQSSLLMAERISVQTVSRHKKDHHWFSFRVWLAQSECLLLFLYSAPLGCSPAH